MPRLTRRAEKDLENLPQRLHDKARQIIGQLDDDPALGPKLLGRLAGKRSARLGRSHRIIYEIRKDEGGLIDDVVVLTIIARKDAYR